MDVPIRVLHVVVNMNRGGAETLIMNLYRNIDRSKVQFDFLTCKEGAFDSEIIELGGKIHRIPYISDVGHFGYIKALNHFFTTHKEYKIVHSHMDKMSGLVLKAAQKAGIPVRIAHSHSTQSEGGMAARLYKWYAGKHILPSSTHLLACSDSAADWLFSSHSSAATILKNGIDVEKFTFSQDVRTEVRKELGIDNESYVIGHVGRFNNPKNHSFLIDIFADFNKIKPESLLILVGDGPLRCDIEKKVINLKLEEKIKFLGIRDDINRLFQTFDVFVFPSLFEGLGMVLIEAQASGLPCLVSDVVPNEADLNLGLLDYIPLSSKSIWVKKMTSNYQRIPSNICSDSINQSGYNIHDSAKWITEFYKSI